MDWVIFSAAATAMLGSMALIAVNAVVRRVIDTV